MPFKRREFVKKTTAVAASIAVAPSLLASSTADDSFFNEKKREPVRIGFIGTGLRGRNHINNILDHEGVVCPAICDISQDSLDHTFEIFEKKGIKKPKTYTGSDLAYQDMLEKESLDGVIIATPWRWHTPMCIDAMEAGVYVGTEVSGAFALEECWDLVETQERTGTHLMILENVCYRRDVMAVLNMVRDNVFGELVHYRCGYQHDLRGIKLNDGNDGLAFGEGASGEAAWRAEHSLKRNGELYPTHGLGPVSMMLDNNRGNRLISVSSFASKARSLKHFVKNHPKGGEDHPYSKMNWKLGDVVTSTIMTANGETIVLTHDTNLPRPYSLGYRVQGVQGLIEFDYGTQRIYVEGKSDPHRWEEAQDWLTKYDHPLWKKYEKEATGAGHGGMDFFLDRAFVESVREKKAPVMDIYDAVSWRAITPLSETSIRNGGAPQEIPDFTRGKWLTRKPIFGLGNL